MTQCELYRHSRLFLPALQPGHPALHPVLAETSWVETRNYSGAKQIENAHEGGGFRCRDENALIPVKKLAPRRWQSSCTPSAATGLYSPTREENCALDYLLFLRSRGTVVRHDERRVCGCRCRPRIVTRHFQCVSNHERCLHGPESRSRSASRIATTTSLRAGARGRWPCEWSHHVIR